MTAVLVAFGGALGTLARYGIGVWLSRLAPGPMPWATFSVNVIGSVLIGLVMAIFAQRGQLDSAARLTLTVGFLGGFTTYSAFALELVELAGDRQFAVFAGYLLGLLVVSVFGCVAGMALGRALA